MLSKKGKYKHSLIPHKTMTNQKIFPA